MDNSGEWEIPQNKICAKLDKLETSIIKLQAEIGKYKLQLSTQEDLLGVFDDSLKDNKIMYCELLKMQRKFHLETKKILQDHKETISKKIEEHNTGYKEIVDMLKDNKDVLNKMDTCNELKKIKPLLKTIKKNNDKISNNLSSAFFKTRKDNLLWRSYNNSFTNNILGIPSVLFNTPVVTGTIVKDNEDDISSASSYDCIETD